MADRDEFTDDGTRILVLAGTLAPSIRQAFLDVVAIIRDAFTLDQIEALLTAGQFEQALITAEQAALRLGNAWGRAYIVSGTDTAEMLAGALRVEINFDQVNIRALEEMRRNQLRLVREFTAEQRLATREALADGVRRGINPRQMAREFKQSIGLTRYQQGIVNNYRRSLELGRADALNRALRDRRFDSTVRRSIRTGVPLTDAQIDRMVARYQQRWIAFRAETIARTEALAAAHAGSEEMYSQAIESGNLDAQDLVRTWGTFQDALVRASHSFMHGQKRGVGEFFTTGAGNRMRFPGDPEAPASERIRDRCAITTRFAIPEPTGAHAILAAAL